MIHSVKADSYVWLDPWYYRKTHVINATSGAGTKYQTLIKVYYGSGTDGTETVNSIVAGKVYLSGKCQSDFDDIRFTDNDGETLLDYWLELKVDSSYALFWVEVADSLSTDPVTIYIYYGNTDASSLSNGVTTFVEFDDFDDESLAWWWDIYQEGGQGSITETGTILHLVSGTTNGFRTCVLLTWNSDVNRALECRVKSNSTYNSRNWAGFRYDSGIWQDYDRTLGYRYDDGASQFNYYSSDENPPSWELTNYSMAIDQEWHRSSTKRTGTAGPKLAIDDEEQTGIYYTTQARAVLLYTQNVNGYVGHLYTDWIAVRKYYETEPAHDVWGEEEEAPAINIDVIITDMEGCGNWVFAEEKYYTFQATVNSTTLDTVSIAFTDGAHWINASYTHSSVTWALDSGSDYVNLKAGTVTQTETQNVITFLIYFKNTILDCKDVDLYLYANSTLDYECDWSIPQSAYFNIYNLGGQSETSSSGNAGRLEGGEPFDFYAYNGSYVASNITFRKLQHIKMLPQIMGNVDVGVSPWDSSYRVYYCLDSDEWVMGLGFTLTMDDYTVGSDRYIEGRVVWFNSSYHTIKTDLIYFYHSATSSGDNTTYRIWIDLWFNKINASTTIGGRVNSFYFPMKDSANPWLIWLTGSNWGINDGIQKQSMCVIDLKDSGGNIISTQQIKLIKIFSQLYVDPGGSGNYVTVSDYDVFDLTFSPFSMAFYGIQTPVFDETRVPVMPQGGFLGHIFSALSNLGKSISEALGPSILGFWNSFVGFLDTIFAWTGHPTLFSDLTSWLSSLSAWLWDSFTYLIDGLTSFFTLIASFMTKLLNTVSTAFTTWSDMITTFWTVLDNTWYSATSLWDTLGLSTWVVILCILYPVYLFMVWDEKGIDAVIGHVKMVTDIFALFLRIFITVIQLFLNIIGRIIESIPIVE